MQSLLIDVFFSLALFFSPPLGYFSAVAAAMDGGALFCPRRGGEKQEGTKCRVPAFTDYYL